MATLGEMWTEAEPRVRVGFATGLLLIGGVTLAAVWFVLRDPMEPLAADLAPHEAAATVEELARLKIEYAVEDGGSRILVPRSQVGEAQVHLAGEGVRLGGGQGFELFDDADFGMTEFAQRINFQRAMQGELARTIGALAEVRTARVHLVLPERGLFGRGGTPATAAVHLQLEGELADAQVAGIQDLVASSVQGLEPASVRIVDHEGITLSPPVASEDEMGLVSSRLEKKREVERYLQEKVVRVLEDGLGKGRAIVSVDATLEMDQVKTTEQRVVTRDDGRGWVTRERESRRWNGENGERDASRDGGVTREVEFAVGRETREVVPMPGAIDRLSVGVLIKADVSVYELSKLREVVAMSVGLDESRGDSISMHAIESVEAAGAALGTTGSAAGPPPSPAARIPATQAPTRRGARTLAERFGALDPVERGLLAVGGVMFVFGLTLLAKGARTSRPEPASEEPSLSLQERDALLSDLRAWLDADASRPGEPEGRAS